MQKDFMTVNPDSGSGGGTVTVQTAANSGDARNGILTISGGGITRTISVNQERFYSGNDSYIISVQSFPLPTYSYTFQISAGGVTTDVPPNQISSLVANSIDGIAVSRVGGWGVENGTVLEFSFSGKDGLLNPVPQSCYSSGNKLLNSVQNGKVRIEFTQSYVFGTDYETVYVKFDGNYIELGIIF